MNARQESAGAPTGIDPSVLAELTNKYRDLQEWIENATQAQAKLAAQETECRIVQEELDNLEPDADVYKLIGACLVKEQKSQAVENVKSRLQYIAKEIENNKNTSAKNKEELDKLVQQIQKIQAPLPQQQIG